MPANNWDYQGPSAIPETVQQHPLDAAVTSCSKNGKSRKRRISECLTLYELNVIPLMKLLCFMVGRQDERHAASGDQQLFSREDYGSQ